MIVSHIKLLCTCLLSLLIILIMSGCKLPKYRTTIKPKELANITTQQICVISFTSDLMVKDFEYLDKYEKDIPEKLNEEYYTSFVSNFGNGFSLMKTKYSQTDAHIKISDKVKIANFLNIKGADIGIIVHNQFGYTWNNASDMVSDYTVVTYFSMVNKQGDEIWRFHAVGKFGTVSSVTGLASDFAAQMRPTETILEDHREFFTNFPTVIGGLIDEDHQGKPHGDEFTDYVDKKELLGYLRRPGKIILFQLAHD